MHIFFIQWTQLTNPIKNINKNLTFPQMIYNYLKKINYILYQVLNQ